MHQRRLSPCKPNLSPNAFLLEHEKGNAISGIARLVHLIYGGDIIERAKINRPKIKLQW